MYEFLSEEWMQAAREIRERYADQLPEVAVTVRINQIITDVPFGEGVLHAYMDTSEGIVVLERGELEDPDAVLMTDYHTAKALIVDQDPTVAMQSFLAGKIKVQGDMMKLMAMQTAMPSNEFSQQVAAEIQAITAETIIHDADDYEPSEHD
jgi:putative sterol carrier protein